MKSFLQKAGLTILVLSLSGMGNAAPAIAGVGDGYEGTEAELSTDAVTETLDAETLPEAMPTDIEAEVDPLAEEMPESLDSEDLASTEETIFDVASSSETFSTLVSALDEAELSTVLQGDGPFTVFAPTDEAFEALPEGTVENLMEPENRDILVSLLTYHVVAEELPVEQLETGFLDSVQGTPLKVEVGEDVTVNGVAIMEEEIPTSNGIIHTIDEVILPPQS